MRRLTYGHHHLNVTSISAHVRFWADALGGESLELLGAENIRFPDVLVRLREQPPTGGTEGTTVNHIGFQVRDLKTAIDALAARGHGVSAIHRRSANTAVVTGPDDVKVELWEDTRLAVPIAMHHIHFAAQNVVQMKSWYTTVFGTMADTADILKWSPSEKALSGTKGRVLDHIAFEVDGLAEFSARLMTTGVTFERPYTKSPDYDLCTAFVVDPWGTSIEFTEGFDRLWRR